MKKKKFKYLKEELAGIKILLAKVLEALPLVESPCDLKMNVKVYNAEELNTEELQAEINKAYKNQEKFLYGNGNDL